MYEFHGWFTIAEKPEEIDDGNLEHIINQIRELLGKLDWPSGFADLRAMNGQYFLHMAGFSNRPRHYQEDIDKLLRFLAERTSGSYGLLYWRDDEDTSPPGMGNFRVSILARGRVLERFDPFLSPTTPIIED